MNCPKCGDELFYSSSTQQEFKCLTLVLKDGRTYEGGDCAKRQRDQLAQRVNELEAALRGLVDCIQETRGKNAYEALHNAHEALKTKGLK